MNDETLIRQLLALLAAGGGEDSKEYGAALDLVYARYPDLVIERQHLSTARADDSVQQALESAEFYVFLRDRGVPPEQAHDWLSDCEPFD